MHAHTHTCTLLCSVLSALLSVVDEDALRKEFKDFMKDSKSQVKCFPPSLSSEHRKIIHEVRIASFLPFLFLFLILILSFVLLSRAPSLCIYLLLACLVPLHLPSLPLSSSLSVCYASAMPLWLHAILSSNHISRNAYCTHILYVRISNLCCVSVWFQIAEEMGLGHISYGSGNARYIEVKKSVVAQPKKKTATPSDGGKSPG